MARNNDSRLVLRKSPGVPVSNRWDDIDGIFDAFRRDMENIFWNPLAAYEYSPRVRFNVRNYGMPMDLRDEEDKFVVNVEMPGVKKENVKIDLQEDILTISVQEEESKEEKDERYLMRERISHSCRRCIQLPGEVDREKISAEMVDGILSIDLPKTEPKKKESIEIKVN
ncbi:MAG: Hsp20/alpha crystallin family protein [Thermoplasmatota archaeon]